MEVVTTEYASVELQYFTVLTHEQRCNVSSITSHCPYDILDTPGHESVRSLTSVHSRIICLIVIICVYDIADKP